jgi:hypothetical protein
MVTATAERAPCSRGRTRHYLAGRLYGVRISALIDGGGELLVSLATPTTDADLATGGPLAQVFCVTASECSLGRSGAGGMKARFCVPTSVTTGTLMLADPALGGNAACEPATTATWQAPKRAISQDQSPPDDS